MRSAFLITTASLAFVTACADDSRPATPEAPTREIALPDGATLRVPERAKRILPMSASAVDYVISLAPREHIVAVPSTATDYSVGLQDRDPWPEADMVLEFSAEAMLARDPDLVIAHVWQTPAEALDVVEAAGVPVLRLGTVESLQDVLDTVHLVASAVDEPRAGAQLAHELQQRAAALSDGAGDRAGLRALSYTNFGSGGWSAGSGTTAHVLIELAGMQNAGATDDRVGHYELDIERLLMLDPDVILLSESTSEYSASRSFLESEAALSSLSALEREWLVSLPASLFSTNSHHLMDSAERLAGEVDALLEQDR
jgi:ABC-type Fe3+-hydroxamate transport system substrate-binding protein